MKPLHTPRLVIRNWEERDRDLFHRINSDDGDGVLIRSAAPASRPMR